MLEQLKPRYNPEVKSDRQVISNLKSFSTMTKSQIDLIEGYRKEVIEARRETERLQARLDEYTEKYVYSPKEVVAYMRNTMLIACSSAAFFIYFNDFNLAFPLFALLSLIIVPIYSGIRYGILTGK